MAYPHRTRPRPDPDVVARRRELVARYRLRGLTQRDIVEQLKKDDFRNPLTEEPWSLGTVNGDLRILEDQWRDRAAEAIDEHKARMLAQLQELHRRAWEVGALDTALRSLQQQREMLGVDAAKVMALTGANGGPIKHEDVGLAEAKAALLRGIVPAIAASGADPAGGGAEPGADQGAALGLGLVGEAESEAPD